MTDFGLYAFHHWCHNRLRISSPLRNKTHSGNPREAPGLTVRSKSGYFSR
jgi:hypothetical protein